MSEDRHPVHAILADLQQPESRAALEEFTGLGELRGRIHGLAESGTRYVCVLVGSGVALVPLPTPRDLIAFQRILIDLALNLGMVQPMPLELDDATHRLLLRELDAQVLHGEEIAGHA